MFFEVSLEITSTLIFSSFSRNKNQQLSDSEIFKIPELAVINKSKVSTRSTLVCNVHLFLGI